MVSVYFVNLFTFLCYKGISSVNGTLRDDHSFNRSSDREVRHLVQACDMCNKLRCVGLSQSQSHAALISAPKVCEILNKTESNSNGNYV